MIRGWVGWKQADRGVGQDNQKDGCDGEEIEGG